ncbi:MAG: hypothetical protein ACRCR2_11530 [Fusobacteriaceae bacterium]
MATKEQKLNIADITFDDFIGDGLTAAEESNEASENLDKEEIQDELENEDDSDDDSNDNDPNDSDDDEDDEEYQSRESEDTDEDADPDAKGDYSIAESIAKALGYEVENEYEDTEEGLVEFTKEIAQNIAEDQINELFQQFPLVQKHLDFVMAGGDSEKFFQAYNPNLDYSQYEIDKGDLRTQKAFISEYFKTKGHDEDFIKDMLEDYEDSGKLYDKATIAQKQLANLQREERESLIEEQKRTQAEAAQKQQEFWEGVANVIDEGKEFAGIRIPEKEKAKFFDYISAPVNKNGATKRDEDYANAELEVKLAIDYLMFKGFKLNDIISTKAKTESAKNLRDRIVNHQEKVKNYGKVDKKMTKFDPDKLDMKKLFE